MQRRVEEADSGGSALEGFKYADEVLALQRQELLESLFAAGFVVGKDHLSHRDDTVAFEEHVFCAAQADAFGAELDGDGSVVRRVGVGADAEFAVLVGQRHYRAERAGQLRIDGVDLADVDITCRAVKADPVTFLEGLAVGGEGFLLVVDVAVASAGNAAFAHSAGDDGCVRGHSASAGEDALGSAHAADVFG